MVTVGADISDMERGLQSARDKISGFGASISSAGAQMAVLTAPIAAFGVAGLMAAGNFEKTMNVLGVTTNATQQQLEGLSKTALDLGKTTSFSALDAAEGLLALARAGFTVGEAQAAIGGVLDLAAAAETDVGTAAKIAANAISAFGLSAEDADRVANLLAAGANASTIGIEDIAQAVQNSGAIFNGYSQSVETLVKATAILGNKGFGGAEAGSTLKTLMTSLFSSTKEQKKVLDSLGVSAYDKVTGQARPLLDIIHDLGAALDGTSKVAVVSGGRTAAQAERFKYLAGVIKSANTSLANYASGVSGAGQTEKARNKSLADLNAKLAAAQAEYNALAGITGTVGYATRTLTEEQKNLLKSTLAGSYGINALNALLGTSAEDYAKVEAELGNVGAATDLADANTKGLIGSFEYFMGTMESLQIGALSPYLDSLGNMIRGTADWLAATVEANPQMVQWGVYIGAAAVAAGPLLIILGGLISAMAGLLSPLGLIIAGIGLLAVAWIRDWGSIQAKTFAAWAIIKPQLELLRDYLIAQIPGALSTLQNLWVTGWAAIQTALASAWAYIAPALVLLYGWLQSVLPTSLGGWINAWSSGWSTIRSALTLSWNYVRGVFLSFNAWLLTNLPTSITGFSVNWGTSWATIRDALQTAWAAIFLNLQSLRNWLATNLSGVVTTFTTFWVENWATIQNSILAAWNVIKPALQSLWAWILLNKEEIERIAKAALGFFIFREVASIVYTLILPFALLAGALSAILGFFINLAIVAKGLVTVIGALFTPVGLLAVAILALSAAFGYLFYYDIGGFRTKTVAAFEALQKAAQAAYDFLAPFFIPALDRIKEAAKTLGERMEPLAGKFQALGIALQPVAFGLAIIGGIIASVIGVVAIGALNLFASALEQLPVIIGAMVANITATLETINAVVKSMIAAVKLAISGDWAGAWNEAKKIVAVYWLYMVNTFNNLVVILGAIWNLIRDTIVNTFKQIASTLGIDLAALQLTWETSWNAITAKLTEWKTKAEGVASYLVNGFKNAWNGFVSWFNDLKLNNPFAALNDWLNGIVKKLGDLLSSLNDVKNWMGGDDTTPAKDNAKTSKRLPSYGGGLIVASASSSMITVNVTVSDPKDKNEWRKVARMVAEEFERVRR